MVGIEGQQHIQSLNVGLRMMLNVGTAKTVGTIKSKREGKGKSKKTKTTLTIKLEIPVTAEIGTRVAISLLINRRYRLVGWGTLKDGVELKE